MACVATVHDQRPRMQDVVKMIEDMRQFETDDANRQSSDDPISQSLYVSPNFVSLSFICIPNINGNLFAAICRSAVMEMEMKNVKAHVLVLSYPATDHTNPMLQFSKSIASRGLQVTFVTFSYNHHKVIRAKESLQRLKLPIQFECIPDDLPQDHTLDSNINSVVFTHMKTNFDGSKLEQLIQRLNASGNAPPVCCIVYNPFLPWARQVSKKMKIRLAMFWTQCTAVFCIYHHFNNGETWDSKQMPKNISVAIPSLPELKLGDLPSAFLPNTTHNLQHYLEQMNGLGDY